jgi:hypothetical protein
MPEEKNDAEVTFKVPHKLLIYLALALGGGGTMWAHTDQAAATEKADQVGQATYNVLSEKLHETMTRVSVLEVRVNALESKRASMTTVHALAPEPPPSPAKEQGQRLLSYEGVKRLVEQRAAAK